MEKDKIKIQREQMTKDFENTIKNDKCLICKENINNVKINLINWAIILVEYTYKCKCNSNKVHTKIFR